MSGLAVLLYAGGTALTAAIVTLFTAGMAAGSMEQRSRKRRYRQLEGPVPGRRGLSDVALKAEADGFGLHTQDDGLVPPPMPASHGPAVPAEAPHKAAQGLPATAPAAADATADLDKFLKDLGIPADALAGDASAQDGSTLDVFAGLDEAEMADTGLDDDLNGIDGGGLPGSTVKAPQKSRR